MTVGERVGWVLEFEHSDGLRADGPEDAKIT